MTEHAGHDESRQALLNMLDTPDGAVAEPDLDLDDQGQGREAAPPSPTALELDDWSLRRGREVLDASKRLQDVFDLGGTDWEDRHQAALATADFHSAAFEPAPQLAKRCKNERLSRYMRQLFETPEFQALHAETQLDETASEIAAASFAEQWVQLAKTDEPADEFKSDMQCLKAASQALGEAASSVSNLRDAQASLGLGAGSGGGGLTSQALAAVFKRVQGSRALKRICELAGRYRRFAQAQQRKKTLHGRDDVVGVVLDGDVGRLLPHELAALDDPDLELDVMRRIVERQAMCRDHRGIEGKARGPIVVVVDESGSMNGEPIYTAKAMALALAWVARHQRRWCCLVGFSEGPHGTFCVIPPGKENPQELLAWLEHFYNGGTTLDVPLDVLPAKWEELGCPKGKTDIVCITDAVVGVPDDMRDRFLAWKRQEQVKMITLVLNSDPGNIGQVSDRVHCVRSLSLEEDAVGEALNV